MASTLSGPAENSNRKSQFLFFISSKFIIDNFNRFINGIYDLIRMILILKNFELQLGDSMISGFHGPPTPTRRGLGGFNGEFNMAPIKYGISQYQKAGQ